MQDLVGIVRVEADLKQALDRLEALKAQAARVGVEGNREYNPGWHTALDLSNLLIISEAIARAALDRRESRGGHFRDDYPKSDPAGARYNIVIQRAPDGTMRLTREPIAEMPAELKQVIEEQK